MISFFTAPQSAAHFAARYEQSDGFQVYRLLPHSAQQSRQARKLLYQQAYRSQE